MKHKLEDDVLDILVSKEEIQQYTEETANKFIRDYKGRRPPLIGILEGACPFLCDLMQAMPIDTSLDFMSVSSYGVSSSSMGEVRTLKDLDTSVQGREIIIVENIIGSGNVLLYLKNLLLSWEAKSVELVTLLNKLDHRTRNMGVKYIGKPILDYSVAGYGLDFSETCRNLPYIGILRPEVYS